MFKTIVQNNSFRNHFLDQVLTPISGHQNEFIRDPAEDQKPVFAYPNVRPDLAPSCGVKTWFNSVTAVCKAALMLQWAKWLRKCVLRGRETIFVNLDESPMAKQMKARRGYV